MPRVVKVQNQKGEFVGWLFECPGCGTSHMPEPGTWSFNDDMERPTFTPSIKVTWTMGPEHTEHVCHSHVTDGRIQFIADSTHDLAGQTVDLPDMDRD